MHHASLRPVLATLWVIALHASALAAQTVSAGPAMQPLAIGSVAPAIDLPVLTGGRMSLSSQRGRPVVLSFWGTWCPPCKAEFPHLVRIYRAHATAGLQVLAVNGLDQESSTKAIHKFVQKYGATFPVLLDEHGSMRVLYRIAGLPMTVFVDSAGVIRRVHTGPISGEELDAGVALLLARR